MVHKHAVAAVLIAPVALLSLSCGGGLDPRCRIEAESPHRDEIARSVAGSDLWDEYFGHISSSSTLVSFSLTMERRTFKSFGGDYDPGKIIVTFVATNLRKSGAELVKQDPEVALDPFMIGSFPSNPTREQVQEIVFKAMEEKIYPYVDRWVNLAAIHAMGQEGTSGQTFVSTLEELVADSWTSGDMKGAAREALKMIDEGVY
jgi:hypothetical protein